MAKDIAKTNKQFEEALKECRTLFGKKLHDYGASWRILRPSSLTDQLFIKAKGWILDTGNQQGDEKNNYNGNVVKSHGDF